MPVFRFAVPVILAALLLVSAEAQPATAKHEPQAVLDFARAQVGKPYKYGATGLARYDCSGLVFRAFRETGLLDRIGDKRRSARGYYNWFLNRGLVTNKPLPGDLVAWGRPVSHIGIYIGTGGSGRHRAISALVNPWGVSDHRVDWINLPFRAYLRVDLDRSGGGGDSNDSTSVSSSTASSSTNSAVTMNLRRGNHTLFRINNSGSVTDQRSISRSSNLTVDVDADIQTINGRPHAQVQSGKWDGWWRRVPDADPDCCLHRFSQTRTLRLQPGNHLMKSFHANNRVVIRHHVSLDQRTFYDVDYRATFNGKRHFLIASGPYEGYWVVKRSSSRLVPLN